MQFFVTRINKTCILLYDFRMYTRLITRIETTCSRLGKDDKFQLFICLAVHDRLLGRIVTDLTKAVAAQQVHKLPEVHYISRARILSKHHKLQ